MNRLALIILIFFTASALVSEQDVMSKINSNNWRIRDQGIGYILQHVEEFKYRTDIKSQLLDLLKKENEILIQLGNKDQTMEHINPGEENYEYGAYNTFLVELVLKLDIKDAEYVLLDNIEISGVVGDFIVNKMIKSSDNTKLLKFIEKRVKTDELAYEYTKEQYLIYLNKYLNKAGIRNSEREQIKGIIKYGFKVDPKSDNRKEQIEKALQCAKYFETDAEIKKLIKENQLNK